MKMFVVVCAAAGLGWGAREQLEDPKPQEAFLLDELVERAQANGRPWLEFLERPSLTCGVYCLPAGASDPQGPHELDEVYYVAAGKARLEVGGESFVAAPGAVLYVERGVAHRFVDIEESLTVLVFFSKAGQQPDDE